MTQPQKAAPIIPAEPALPYQTGRPAAHAPRQIKPKTRSMTIVPNIDPQPIVVPPVGLRPLLHSRCSSLFCNRSTCASPSSSSSSISSAGDKSGVPLASQRLDRPSPYSHVSAPWSNASKRLPAPRPPLPREWLPPRPSCCSRCRASACSSRRSRAARRRIPHGA